MTDPYRNQLDADPYRNQLDAILAKEECFLPSKEKNNNSGVDNKENRD